MSLLEYTLFGETANIRWGIKGVFDVPGLQNSVPGEGIGCLEGDPLFANPTSNPTTADFRLLPASPAVDTGALEDVYQTFLNRYGIDIQVDADGNLRPAGVDWDMGAFEAQ